MNIFAAILIIGASGHATRSLESEQTIPEIVVRVVAGGVKDVLRKAGDGQARSVVRDRLRVGAIPSTDLCIDGEPRTGWRAWGEAACRTVGYAADWINRGSVEYRYQLASGGYVIGRRTEISDGHVTLTTNVWWTETVEITKRVTRRVPIHVRIDIRASESGEGFTAIVGRATGMADTSDFRCPIVRRIAERQATDALRVGLPKALYAIESTGRGWHDAVELPDGLRSIGAGIRAIGRAR